MPSRKRKLSSVDGESRDQEKRVRVNDNGHSVAAVASYDDDVDDNYSTDNEEDEHMLRRVSKSPMYTQSQTSKTQREAGIIEQVEVVNFMSHAKLNFEYVVCITTSLLHLLYHCDTLTVVVISAAQWFDMTRLIGNSIGTPMK